MDRAHTLPYTDKHVQDTPMFVRRPGASPLLLSAGDQPALAKHISSTVRSSSGERSGRPNARKRTRLVPRSFSPLTPIVASPITTPTTSMSSTSFYVAPDRESAKEMLAALQGTPLQQDYLTKGFPAPLPSGNAAIRAVDVSQTPHSIPPTPPTKSNSQLLASLESRRVPTSIEPSASLPASSDEHATETYALRRRSSLSLMSMSKDLPKTPPTPPSPSHKGNFAYVSTKAPLSPLRDTFVATDSKKAIFHVPEGSDREDDDPTWAESPQDYETADEAPEADEESKEIFKDNLKDNLRRYHALTELLTTEMGYVRDLRELINGYIRQLPMLSCRSASTGPFGSSSNLSIPTFSRSPTTASFNLNSSQTHLPLAGSNPATHDGTAVSHKGQQHSRYMFSDEEIDLVTRNVEDIFHFHQDFVDDLRMALEPLGFSLTAEGSESPVLVHSKEKKGIGPPSDALEAAIAAVADKIKVQAAGFELYETFCAGHPEAFDLVRKLQNAHSQEWESFEQRASHMVADMRKPTSFPQTVEGHSLAPMAEEEELFAALRRRRHSLSSLEAPERLPRSQHLGANLNATNTSAAPNGITGRDRSARLVFIDYLIKPVQRICKYPLLIDQLKCGKSLSPSTPQMAEGQVDPDIAVDVASQAMKNVAASVDEARRRRDIATKSSLVLNRILNSGTSQTTSSLRALVGHTISPAFMNSLGTCLFAGSLDVIHYHADKIPGSSGTVKAKYLGAFLYMGGYLILVKVSKGPVYEPRHWCSLTGFELIDVPEEDSLLPCSLRLSRGGHLLDLAAACQREKDLWITAIHESFKYTPSWVNEPVSSLDSSNGVLDAVPPVPPHHARSLDGHPSDWSASAVRADLAASKRPELTHVSHRSSTASVKAIFAASETTILIRRASPNARYAVESGLLDMFSEMCLTARLRAGTQDEELFQAPKIVRGGFSRSTSGLVMTGMGVAAKNRLTKRESVLVPRRTGGSDTHGYMAEVEVQHLGVPKAPARSLPSRKLVKKLKITSPPLGLTVEGEVCETPDSPPALSQCSSQTGSNSASRGNSPVTEAMPSLRPPILRASTTIPRPNLLAVQESHFLPIRSRSMVEGVKEMFHSRSLSPGSSASGHHSLPPPSPQDPRPTSYPKNNYSLFKRFSGSLRRRVQSEPKAPDEEPLQKAFCASAAAQESPKSTAVRRNHTTKERSCGLLSANQTGQLRPYDDRAESPLSDPLRPTPIRRRSLFTSSSSRREMMASTGDEPVPPIPPVKRNKSFLQRFSPLNTTTTAPIAAAQ
ncbi:hypothetical protein HWV62_32794 [Athelia sp. TMB]|nr:hypothetical protein HWV62_32794 [Athelia sp. TMB]